MEVKDLKTLVEHNLITDVTVYKTLTDKSATDTLSDLTLEQAVKTGILTQPAVNELLLSKGMSIFGEDEKPEGLPDEGGATGPVEGGATGPVIPPPPEETEDDDNDIIVDDSDDIV